MKKINIKEYDSLKIGEPYIFETIGLKRDGESIKLAPISQERGELVRVLTREKEIKKDDKWTGQYETVGDIVVYKTDDPNIHRTVIGCGMFRIYKEE